jgi:hypothetical protein
MKHANIGAILNFDLCDLQKVLQIKKPGIISCILIRCTYDKNWEMIHSTFCVFGFGPLVAKPTIRLDRNFVCELLLPSGTYVQSLGSIAPAVMKCALLTDDDDDGHSVMA